MVMPVMKKKGQDYSLYNPALSGRTLDDLLRAIRMDVGLPTAEKARLVNQIKSMTGFANAGTPLSSLTYGGLGGLLGWLISKYFGMGPTGQVVSSALGFGIGKRLNKQLNRPPDPFPGYRLL